MEIWGEEQRPGRHSCLGTQSRFPHFCELFLRSLSPISSVDVINATEIFNKVLLNYLKGKTRILFKHDIRNLHRMDKIIYMNKGKVIWSGTYDEFTKHKLYMELLSRVHKKTNTQEQAVSH